MHNAVAIVGMGGCFPGAPDLPSVRRTLRQGGVHTAPIPRSRWDHSLVHSDNPREPNRTRARRAALLDDIESFCPEFFGVTPKRARLMDPQQRLILETTRQALENAGYARRPLAGRVGVYMGASSADHRQLATAPVNFPLEAAGRVGVPMPGGAVARAAATRGLSPISAYTIVGQQINMIAANVSQAFNFDGPALTIDTACSSALAALHTAVLHLRAGAVDAAVVGGVYVLLDPTMMVCFARIGALSPTDACRPFEAAADGFVLGEGAGAAIVKRLEDAERDGDTIIAVVRGIAMNNDGRGPALLTPSVPGQKSVIAQAWADAGAEPASVGLIEAHATATHVGDGTELAALSEVFGGRVRDRVPIGSVKANFGHGLASAGMASLIRSALALRDASIPPQPLSGPLRAELAGPADWLRVPGRLEPWKAAPGTPRRAGVSAFGFGGTNVHVVLEEAPVRAAAAPGHGPHVFRIGAPSRELLSSHLRACEQEILESDAGLSQVAAALFLRRQEPVELRFAASSKGDLLGQISAHAAALSRGEGVPAPAAEPGPEAPGGRMDLALLPPSPLRTRRFWIVGETGAAPAGDGDAPEATYGATFALVASAIEAVSRWPAADVRPEHRFAADLGFDSLMASELATSLGAGRPGGTPPLADLLQPGLTVSHLVSRLSGRPAARAEATAWKAEPVVLGGAKAAWISDHRPGGRPTLPMAALASAALKGPGSVTNFRVHAPARVEGNEARLSLERGEAGAFRLLSPEGLLLASGTLGTAEPPAALLPRQAEREGPMDLAEFYGEFAFHGPAMQALCGAPRVGPLGASASVQARGDPVLGLDGALQAGLYWLAADRRQTAVARGFSRLLLHAPWPETGSLECVAALAGEPGGALRGDFDLFAPGGALVAQWRGVEAHVLPGAAAAQGGPGEFEEVRAFGARKRALSEAGLKMPFFKVHENAPDDTAVIGGRSFVNFSSYNYLGLAGEPAVVAAARDALARFGASSSASRIASGERPVHGELEAALAGFLGCEDALALVSGYATNLSVITHLLGPDDLVVHDSLAHHSIVAGARFSGARRLAFPHNDAPALAGILERERQKARRALVAVEGVYSMDGDLAPLPEIVALKKRHDCMLLVDEAHSLGVLGPTGRGAGEHFGTARGDVDLWMGTLSKSLASCGGYLAGSSVLIDYLRYTLPGFIFSVGLPPASAAAAVTALGILRGKPELPRLLRARSDLFRRLCRDRSIPTGESSASAVIPVIVGSSERALRLAEALGERGINVQPVFHPAVDEGSARLRFFVMATHTEDQLRGAADALSEELAALAGRREAAWA
ncbi:MAG TPA: aminotransferase class I/II-fold pyridoxal phosphate-dependent enzyme [Opitutaceae bacterium]|jgi:8-amino-7-oxononanoate synthase